MIVYHTGFQEIPYPDVHFGRKTADFGQGFYLTKNQEFARRWAKERKDRQVILNTYSLEMEGLRIHRLQRDPDWFQYISANRAGKPDTIDADIVMGPIANDTLFYTFGVITSGFLKPEEAMRLLMIGPEYQQIALKTEKATAQLKWITSEVISSEELKQLGAVLAAEEEEYQKLFGAEMERLGI